MSTIRPGMLCEVLSPEGKWDCEGIHSWVIGQVFEVLRLHDFFSGVPRWVIVDVGDPRDPNGIAVAQPYLRPIDDPAAGWEGVEMMTGWDPRKVTKLQEEKT